MVSWSTIERSSFQMLQLPKTGPCKFSHFVIGNEAPYLTKLPLFSGKFPSKLTPICIICLVLIDLLVPIEAIHSLQVLHCQADVTKPHQAPRHHVTKPETLLVSLGSLVLEMNIIRFVSKNLYV